MSGNIAARRYARALFTLGEKTEAAGTFGKDLADLAECMDNSPELLKLIRSLNFGAQEKKAVLGELVAKLGMAPTTANFLNLLADKDRLAALPDIQKIYAELLDEAQGVVRGKIITAGKLSAARRKDIQAKLEKKSGKKLVLSYDEDKAILGGVVLKVGDKVLDASLRAQLRLLKEQIKRGE